MLCLVASEHIGLLSWAAADTRERRSRHTRRAFRQGTPAGTPVWQHEINFSRYLLLCYISSLYQKCNTKKTTSPFFRSSSSEGNFAFYLPTMLYRTESLRFIWPDETLSLHETLSFSFILYIEHLYTSMKIISFCLEQSGNHKSKLNVMLVIWLVMSRPPLFFFSSW